MAIDSQISQKTRTRTEVEPLTGEERSSLVEQGEILEGQIPWLIRVIAAQGDRLAREIDPGRRISPDLVQINKKRRSARSLLVHLFKGEVDDHFLATLRGTLLPILLGPGIDRGAARAESLFTAIQGLITGCLFSEPRENLVPRARMKAALEHAIDRMRASC